MKLEALFRNRAIGECVWKRMASSGSAGGAAGVRSSPEKPQYASNHAVSFSWKWRSATVRGRFRGRAPGTAADAAAAEM